MKGKHDIPVISHDVESRVLAALEDRDYQWRTVDGLTRDTGLTTVEVETALKNLNGSVVRSSIPDKLGRSLYTTRNHYKATHSIASRLLNAVSDKVA